jgi:hypothetical protein
MRNDNPPVHPLPWLYSPYQEMTDEEVDAVHDFLLELINAFGNRYASQLHRAARKREKALRKSNNET